VADLVELLLSEIRYDHAFVWFARSNKEANNRSEVEEVKSPKSAAPIPPIISNSIAAGFF
jgi:hypothetical protein